MAAYLFNKSFLHLLTAQVLPIQVFLVQILPISTAIIQIPLLILLAPLSPAEYNHEYPKIQPEQFKIMPNKVDTFTNKHADVQLSISRQ